MNIIVFSKDRAMQLDLFLRSFNIFVENAYTYTINVLYTYSTLRFKQGYDKIIDTGFTNVNFVKEFNFKCDLLSFIDEDIPTTVFFVDDDVFKNPVDFYDDQMALLWDNGNILCRSLRLHPNLKYCYPAGVPMRPPQFFRDGIFEWRGQLGDYGYPASLDGHIFITKDILPFLVEFEYYNPNTLEGAMLRMRMDKPYMVCYQESIIINIPLNRVQTVNNNIYGNITAEYLNELYLQGKVIDLVPIMGIKNISCHQEVNISFI